MDYIGGEYYGGYLIPASGVQASWTVYSFGVGEDITFDKGLIDRFGCEIHAFDPTPRAIDFGSKASEELTGFHFYPYGIGTSDGRVRFYAPSDPSHVSHSALNIQGTKSYIEAEVRTLESIRSMLGHDRIDLLKMNIEGAELSILNMIADRQIQIPVIVATLEAPVPFVRYRRTLDCLQSIGYAIESSDRMAVTLLHLGQLKNLSP